MNNLNLIHLVSEQTMQNLIPIMALRPKRVIQVCSANRSISDHAQRLAEAVSCMRDNLLYRDLNPEFETLEISEKSPSAAATEAVVRNALRNAGQAVVNFTGGTKLMSIGAWRAAEACGQPALYCDTQSRRFVLERPTSELVLPPFEQVVAGLSVPVALAAHGIKPDRLKFETPTDHKLKLAEIMQGLWLNHESEMSNYFRNIRTAVYPGGKLIPKSEVTRLIQSGLPPPPPELTSMLDAAETAGLLLKQGKMWKFNVPESINNDQKVRRLASLYQTLEGGWFEILTWQRMQSSGRFLDAKMNLESREQISLGENDVLAVDLKRLALTFVSCKNSDAHIQPLEHVYAFRQRATEFGGSHAGAILCIRECLNQQKRDTLKLACEAARVEFVEGDPTFS